MAHSHVMHPRYFGAGVFVFEPSWSRGRQAFLVRRRCVFKSLVSSDPCDALRVRTLAIRHVDVATKCCTHCRTTEMNLHGRARSQLAKGESGNGFRISGHTHSIWGDGDSWISKVGSHSTFGTHGCEVGIHGFRISGRCSSI